MPDRFKFQLVYINQIPSFVSLGFPASPFASWARVFDEIINGFQEIRNQFVAQI
nr:hypothetical protein [uncultured bacterium]